VRRIPWPSPDRQQAVFLLGLGLLLLALFSRVLLLGEVFYERDVLLVWVAQVEAFVRSIHAGSLPVWDPGVAFGHPMLGNPNTQVFYPFTWLNLLIQPLTLYVFYALAHLALAGAGFRLWARRAGLSPEAATLSALVFVASGPLLSFVNVWHHLAGASLLPWALWAADHAMSEARPRAVLGLAAIIGLQIFAGSPDLCIFTGLILGADALRRAGTGPSRAKPLGVLVIAYLLGAGLAAAQIAPSVELVLHSGSRPIPFEGRTLWSLHPAALVQTLVPMTFRDLPPLAPNLAQSLFDLWSPFMKSNYLGLASLCLVGWALAAAERRTALFFGFLFVTSLAVSLGRYSPAYEWLCALVPPLTMVRYPSKAAIVAALAWAMLTGLGYDAWRRGPDRVRAAFRIGALAFVVGLAVFLAASALGVMVFPGTLRLPMEGPAWGQMIALSRSNVITASSLAVLVACLCVSGKAVAPGRSALVAFLVMADLAVANRQINPTTGAGLLNQRPDILAAIPRDTSTRVYAWDYVLRAPGRGHDTAGMLGIFMEVAMLKDPALGSLAFQAYLYPPSAARWGLRGSFDRDLLGLYPPWINEMNLLVREVEDTPAYTRLLQIAGVSRVVTLHRDIEALPRVMALNGIVRLPIQVFSVPDPWPRTWVACQARFVPGPKPFMTLLAQDFDPNREVLVDREVKLEAPCRQGESRIVEDRPDRVTLDVNLDGSGVVTLLDGAERGWRVLVDDAPAQILRINHIFRGVRADAGRHRVTFIYRPQSLVPGLVITTIVALFMLVLASRSRAG
jgi:hypothetical protein